MQWQLFFLKLALFSELVEFAVALEQLVFESCNCFREDCFEGLIGCRVGDLYKMTGSVINGAIEYVPRKTKEENPITVRVPLNEKAQFILEKYKDEKINCFHLFFNKNIMNQ